MIGGNPLIFIQRVLFVFLIMGAQVQAADDENISDPDGSELSGGSENASNPLAAVNNTDLRWQYSDLTTNDDRMYDYFIEGAVLLFPWNLA